MAASFQEIYNAALARYGQQWVTLAPTQQTNAIYFEMRRIDAEQAAKPLPAPEATEAEWNAAALEQAQREIVLRFRAAGEFRDEDTGEHVSRIGMLAHRLAVVAGCDDTFARNLKAVAPLHDIGKIATPDAILHKPGGLTPAELVEMRKHAEIGARILGGTGLPLLDLAASIAHSHHENWDGTGYPCGLALEAIPLSGRIVAIVDVFDALLSVRPYKKPWPVEKVVAFLREQAGRKFDPELVAAFLGELKPMLAIRRQYMAPQELAGKRL